MLSYVNAKLLINHFYTGWKTTKILKDGRLVKAVPRAAAAYGRQLKIEFGLTVPNHGQTYIKVEIVI